jgi:hypothetical protein
MSNTILTPTAVTREAQMILHNNLAFVKNVNRQYDDEYQTTGQKDGASIKIRLPNRYAVRTGKTIQAQDTTETSVTLTRATQKGVDMTFSTAELTTDLGDFSKRILAPAVSKLASQLDYDALGMTFDVYNLVGTAGTTPATAQVWLDAMAKLDNMACPRDQNRTAVMNPKAMSRTVDGLKGLFEAGDAISDQYKNGVMKRALGIKWAMDQNVRSLTLGTQMTSLIVASTAAESATTLALSGTGTWAAKVGDVFTVASVNSVNPETGQDTGELAQFVVTTAISGTTTITVAVSPTVITTGAKATVTRVPTSSDVVTVVGSASTAFPHNLVFHEDAFAFATIDLEVPKGVHFAAREVKDGISLRIVRQYDINNDNIPARLDVLYGYVTMRPELACRVIG